MNEYTNILYNYICGEVNDLENAPLYNNEMSADKWIKTYWDVLKIYALTNDERVIKIMSWYKSTIDDHYISFSGDLKLVYNYIVANHSLPNRNSDDIFYDNLNMFNWLMKKRHIIKKLANQGNRYANYIIIYINDYLNKCVKQKAEDSVNYLKHQEKFERHLDEYYNYIQSHHRSPNAETVFSDGKLMIAWRNANRYEIGKYALNGNKKAQFIVDSITRKTLKINDKVLELIQYIKVNLNIPMRDSGANFSNDSNMGYGFIKIDILL